MGVAPHNHRRHGAVVEEIEGLIRVHKDGHVQRFPVIHDVSCTWSPDSAVASTDVLIDTQTQLWARLYVPKCPSSTAKLPLLVYFHGGGFCVASAAWSCYHDFLSGLALKAGCIIVSVNYRLAPEHRLPAAYDDGFKVVKWLRQQDGRGSWWSDQCDLSRLFLAGDSAGGTIAYNVAAGQVSGAVVGVILIQPFFGGEKRTPSEKSLVQAKTSALTLGASDTYWRLALPIGAGRDHEWCNPVMGLGRWVEEKTRNLPRILLFVAGLDLLRDRNTEFVGAVRAAGKGVKMVQHDGVGHGFQVLSSSRLAKKRTHEMMDEIKNFVNNP